MMQLLSWAQNNQVLSILVLFTLLVVLKELVSVKLARRQMIYYIVLFPGIILHEISHIAGCLMTLTKVRKIKLFSSKGGFVIHEKPALPILGMFIISIAPLVAGLFISHILFGLIYTPEGLKYQLSTAIYLYLIFSIILTMLPSKTDIINSLPAYIIIAVTVIALGSELSLPYFQQMLLFLAALVVLLFLSYLVILFFGQNRLLGLK